MARFEQKYRTVFSRLSFRLVTIATAGVVFATGLVISRLLAYAFHFNAPRMAVQAPESIAIFYLLGGSVLLVGGILWLIDNIQAKKFTRWITYFVFLYLGFAVSTTIESAIYSTAPGILTMIFIFLLPCVLLAGILVFASNSIPVAQNLGFGVHLKNYFHMKSATEWSWRILLAIVSFPMIYFLFGIIASVFVADYYNAGVAELRLPAPQVIVQVQVLRSVLHLIAIAPILILWKGSRQSLIIALALAFFVFVFTYDIILAIQIPATLILVHGVEVLIDSCAYSWVLVSLLYRKPSARIG